MMTYTLFIASAVIIGAAARDYARECKYYTPGGRNRRNCNALQDCCEQRCRGRLDFICDDNGGGQISNARCDCEDDGGRGGTSRRDAKTDSLIRSYVSRTCRQTSDDCPEFQSCCRVQCGRSDIKYRCKVGRFPSPNGIDAESLCDCNTDVDASGVSTDASNDSEDVDFNRNDANLCRSEMYSCSSFRSCCSRRCGGTGSYRLRCDTWSGQISGSCRCK